MAIFVNYRRQDSQGITGRIDDHLRRAFGDDDVYRDVDNVQIGVDFVEHIGGALSKCDVGVAVIGRTWVSPRLHEAKDLVRVELEYILNNGTPLIPVLVEGAQLPKSDDLPPSLRPLLTRNAIEVDSGSDFKPHMRRLISAIKTLRRQRGRTNWRIFVIGGAATSLLALSAIAWAVLRPRPNPLPTISSTQPDAGPDTWHVVAPGGRSFRAMCDDLLPSGSFVFDPPALGKVAVTELCTQESADARWTSLAEATSVRLDPPNPFYVVSLANKADGKDLRLRLSSPQAVQFKLGPTCAGVKAIAAPSPQEKSPYSVDVAADCTATLPLPVQAWGKTLELSVDPVKFRAAPVVFDGLTKSVIITDTSRASTSLTSTAAPTQPCERECASIRACRKARAKSNECSGLVGPMLQRCTACAEEYPSCQSKCS
jgi:hypothetical protein